MRADPTYLGHWHVIVEEGDKKPRIVKVHDRRHAELEACIEGKCPKWVPFRKVRIAACGDDCLAKRWTL